VLVVAQISTYAYFGILTKANDDIVVCFSFPIVIVWDAVWSTQYTNLHPALLFLIYQPHYTANNLQELNDDHGNSEAAETLSFFAGHRVNFVNVERGINRQLKKYFCILIFKYY